MEVHLIVYCLSTYKCIIMEFCQVSTTKNCGCGSFIYLCVCVFIPSTLGEKFYFQFFESNIIFLYFSGIQIVGGIWADKIGGKQVLGFGVVWWSVATILTPIAARVGLPFLLVMRAFMGIGEVGLFQSYFLFLLCWICLH